MVHFIGMKSTVGLGDSTPRAASDPLYTSYCCKRVQRGLALFQASLHLYCSAYGLTSAALNNRSCVSWEIWSARRWEQAV